MYMLLKHFVEYSYIIMFFPAAYLMKTEQQQKGHLMKSAVLRNVVKHLVKSFYLISKQKCLISNMLSVPVACV